MNRTTADRSAAPYGPHQATPGNTSTNAGTAHVVLLGPASGAGS
jgi:hypothetical protein